MIPRSFKVLLTIFCLLKCAATFGQNVPAILSVGNYKEGIYKTYSEFLKNDPSIKDSFTFKSSSSEKKINDGEGVYKLILTDSALNRRDLKKIWGFSDGKSIFVNEFVISGKPIFRKLQGVGRYCYLKATPPSQYVYSPGLIDGLLASAIINAATGDQPYVLNINNGKFFALDKAVLTSILQKDKQLLQEYQNASKKRKDFTLEEYVTKYNDRHLEEADASLWFDRDVVIYRFTKKELDNPVRVKLNDTLALSFPPGSLQRLQIQGEKVTICLPGGSCKDVPLYRKGVTFISLSQRKLDDVIVRQTESYEAKPFLEGSDPEK